MDAPAPVPMGTRLRQEGTVLFCVLCSLQAKTKMFAVLHIPMLLVQHMKARTTQPPGKAVRLQTLEAKTLKVPDEARHTHPM
jgi:hypothetical protein